MRSHVSAKRDPAGAPQCGYIGWSSADPSKTSHRGLVKSAVTHAASLSGNPVTWAARHATARFTCSYALCKSPRMATVAKPFWDGAASAARAARHAQAAAPFLAHPQKYSLAFRSFHWNAWHTLMASHHRMMVVKRETMR